MINSYHVSIINICGTDIVLLLAISGVLNP